MGVKTTKLLTRAEAEERLGQLTAQLTADVQTMGDLFLADLLAALNDYAAGGESYENFRIVAEIPA